VFTPNKFCIDYYPEENVVLSPDSKDGMQPRTKLAGSGTAGEEVAIAGLSVQDRFWKMVRMKREVGKPVPLWNFWHV